MGSRLLRLVLLSFLSLYSDCRSDLSRDEFHQVINEDNDANVGHDFDTRTHVFKESVRELSTRNDLVKRGLISPEYIHEVVFAVEQKNMEELTRVLHDVSNPMSSNYGQHWTREKIINFTSNPYAHDTVVSYLLSNGISSLSETLSGEFIKASAPIVVWEKMFNTEFFTFYQTHEDKSVEKIIRAEKYWIPRELDKHINCVFYTIEMPIVRHHSVTQPSPPSKSKSRIKENHSRWIDDDSVTPDKIKKHYNMSHSIRGSHSVQQAIYTNDDSDFSLSDMHQFQMYAGLPFQNILKTENRRNQSQNFQRSVKSNLNLQYMMAISPLSSTVYSSIPNNDFIQWLISATNTTTFPSVMNILWSYDESTCTMGSRSVLMIQSIKLSLMGATIIATSGINGANSGNQECGYNPDFFSSCPYITSVGSTMVRFLDLSFIFSLSFSLFQKDYFSSSFFLPCLFFYLLLCLFLLSLQQFILAGGRYEGSCMLRSKFHNIWGRVFVLFSRPRFSKRRYYEIF